MTKATGCRLPSDENTSACANRGRPGGGPSPPLAMPASPQLLGEAEGPATIACFVYVVANVYNTSPFGPPEVCATPPSSSPEGAASVLGRGGHVPGPGASVCSAGHRLLRRVWKPSPGPERPVWAYTGPAPASPSPHWALQLP